MKKRIFLQYCMASMFSACAGLAFAVTLRVSHLWSTLAGSTGSLIVISFLFAVAAKYTFDANRDTFSRGTYCAPKNYSKAPEQLPRNVPLQVLTAVNLKALAQEGGLLQPHYSFVRVESDPTEGGEVYTSYTENKLPHRFIIDENGEVHELSEKPA